MGSPRDVQFIGMIRTDNMSEIDIAMAQTVEGAIDPAFVAEFARAHEEGEQTRRRLVKPPADFP